MHPNPATRPRNFGWKPQLPHWGRTERKRYPTYEGFLAARIARTWRSGNRALTATGYFKIPPQEVIATTTPEKVLGVMRKILNAGLRMESRAVRSGKSSKSTGRVQDRLTQGFQSEGATGTMPKERH